MHTTCSAIMPRMRRFVALSTNTTSIYFLWSIQTVVTPVFGLWKTIDFEAGFTYTQSTDRLWRKNRQTTSGSSCLGTDINRNWNYQWSTPGGSSTDPCAQDYRGSGPSSAPENVGLTAFVNKLAQSTTGLKLYIDYHSYSQLFMTRKLPLREAIKANNNVH